METHVERSERTQGLSNRRVRSSAFCKRIDLLKTCRWMGKGSLALSHHDGRSVRASMKNEYYRRTKWLVPCTAGTARTRLRRERLVRGLLVPPGELS